MRAFYRNPIITLATKQFVAELKLNQTKANSWMAFNPSETSPALSSLRVVTWGANGWADFFPNEVVFEAINFQLENGKKGYGIILDGQTDYGFYYLVEMANGGILLTHRIKKTDGVFSFDGYEENDDSSEELLLALNAVKNDATPSFGPTDLHGILSGSLGINADINEAGTKVDVHPDMTGAVAGKVWTAKTVEGSLVASWEDAGGGANKIKYDQGGAAGGAVVNPTGTWNTLYVDCSLTGTELNAILDNLTFRTISGIMQVYEVFANNEYDPSAMSGSAFFIIKNYAQQGVIAMGSLGDEPEMLVYIPDSLPALEITEPGWYKIVNEQATAVSGIQNSNFGLQGVTGIATVGELTIGADNSELTQLFSFNTPFQPASAEGFTLYKDNDAIAGQSTKVTLKTINNNSLIGTGNIAISAGGYVEKTYSELATMKTNSALSAGQLYRITDFVTTTALANTQSGGHAFDLIVLANGVNSFSEVAYAAKHSGDTYFANCNLSAWKIWYCFDNDTTRFNWADSANGKGVIYRMIDEHGNDVPYDFKNIKFLGSQIYNRSWFRYTNTSYYYYTFSAYNTTSTIESTDLTVEANCYVRNNFIDTYKFYGATYMQGLNFIIFLRGGYNVKIKGLDSQNMTFGGSTENSVIENCYNISLGGYSTSGGSTAFGQTHNVYITHSHDIKYNYNSHDLYIKYSDNITGERGLANHFIDYSQYITIGEGASSLILEPNVRYLNLTTNGNTCPNNRICSGVKGSSSSNLRQIIFNYYDNDRDKKSFIYRSNNSEDIMLDD